VCSIVNSGYSACGLRAHLVGPTPGYASCFLFKVFLIKLHSFLIYDTSGGALRVYSSFNNIVAQTSKFLTEIQTTVSSSP